jgi:hypothetical protein
MSWVETAVIIAIIVLIFTGGASMIASLFKNFANIIKDAVGVADTLFVLLQDQLNTCKKHGFFAFWKGCIIGIGATGFIGFYLLFKFIQAWGTIRGTNPGQKEGSPGADAFNTALQLGDRGTDVAEDMNEARKTVEEWLTANGLDPDENRSVYEIAIRAAVADRGCRRCRALAERITDPAQKKAILDSIAEKQQRATDAFNEEKSNLSEEEADDATHARAIADAA